MTIIVFGCNMEIMFLLVEQLERRNTILELQGEML